MSTTGSALLSATGVVNDTIGFRILSRKPEPPSGYRVRDQEPTKGSVVRTGAGCARGGGCSRCIVRLGNIERAVNALFDLRGNLTANNALTQLKYG